ncbi:META domain-containing protein [Chitinophaga sp. 30R24]|uniref:META domain-containing protein n=1 Tax=Chitinophaga sp. 30R24 TaxID=3248838 RepID=UPI003B91FED7
MLLELAFALVTTFASPLQNKQQPVKMQVIYVKEAKEPCTGVTSMECLQIKGVNDTEWSNLYTGISGFKYIPGYRYKLQVRVTTVKNPPADAASVKYALNKILEKKKVAASSSSAFDKKWVLTNINGANISDGNIWVAFDANNKRIHGKSGCNNMMGNYVIEGNRITFSQTAGTMMACPDTKVMQQEAAFMKQLGDHSFQYTVSGATARLLSNGKTILQFRLEQDDNDPSGAAAQWSDISDKRWILTRLNDATVSKSGVWIEFDTDKQRYQGKGGCNNLSGTYTLNDNTLSFAPAVSTRMACPDASIMQLENNFLQRLGGHSFTYTVGKGLVNLFENGILVLQFSLEEKASENNQVLAPDDSEWALMDNKNWNSINSNDIIYQQFLHLTGI